MPPMASPEAIFTAESIKSARYSILAAATIIVFEWFQFIEMEIEMIHKGIWSTTKIAYLLCRYYPICFWPFLIYGYIWGHSQEVCSRWAPALHVSFIPFQLIAQAVVLMRAYAFSGRSNIIGLILLMGYGVVAGFDIWTFSTTAGPPPQMLFDAFGTTACLPNYGRKEVRSRLGITVLVATGVDVLALSIIIWYCWRKGSFRNGSLTRYIVKQGLGGFGAVCLVHIFAMVMYYQTSSPMSRIGLPFLAVMANVISCRLILLLRKRSVVTDTRLAREVSAAIRDAFDRYTLEWVIGETDESSRHDNDDGRV